MHRRASRHRPGGRKAAQPGAERSLTSGRRSSRQGLSPSESGGHELEDRRLDGIERGEHPGDRARPGVGICGNSPAWCSAMWRTIAPVSNRTSRLPRRSGSGRRMKARCAGSFIGGTRRGGPRRAGPLPRAPSGRACRAPGPCRRRATLEGGDGDGHGATPPRFVVRLM